MIQKVQVIRVVATFFGLWISVSLLGLFEVYLAFFLIFSFGILHGSNDIKLIKCVYGEKEAAFLRILLNYIVIITIGTALFFMVPLLALVLFVLFSSYHFGEQHFHFMKIKNSILSFILYSGYGLLVISLLLYLKASAVIPIISEMTHVTITLDFLRIVLLVSTVVSFISGALIYLKQGFNVFIELFYLLLFAIVFFTTSLLWAFALYFILWHSIPSLADQIQYLYKEVSKKTILQYIRTSFIYWFISVIGFVILVQFFKDNHTAMLSFFFSFLAAITFPHVLVMHKILKN